jgi:hypothetical protein
VTEKREDRPQVNAEVVELMMELLRAMERRGGSAEIFIERPPDPEP